MRVSSSSVLGFTGSRVPPPNQWSLPIFKVKKEKTIRGICCAPDLTSIFVHYYNDRTRPCVNLDCEGCRGMRKRQLLGWFPIVLADGLGHGFCEVPYSAFESFDRQLSLRGSCENWVVSLARVGENNCGRVRAIFERPAGGDFKVPAFPDTRRWLYGIWGISFGADEGPAGSAVASPNGLPNSPLGESVVSL